MMAYHTTTLAALRAVSGTTAISSPERSIPLPISDVVPLIKNRNEPSETS